MATTIDAARLQLALSIRAQTNERPVSGQACLRADDATSPAGVGGATRLDISNTRDTLDRLSRLMTRLLDAWKQYRDHQDEPGALADLLAAAHGLLDDDAPAQLRSALTGRPMSSGTRTNGDRAAPDSAPDSQQPSAAAGGAATPAMQPGTAAGRREEAHFSLQLTATYQEAADEIAGQDRGGITVVDAHTLRTERYEIKFERVDAVRITDLSTGQWTRVWGDPHVDLSTMPGEHNGDFGDLRQSNDVTTFQLRDGTRIRFQAPDDGVIRGVDVVRGDAAVHGTGLTNRGDVVGMFHQIEATSDVPSDAGDVVTAGDDGASWYDASGRLVWGAQGGRELSRETRGTATLRVDERNRL